MNSLHGPSIKFPRHAYAQAQANPAQYVMPGYAEDHFWSYELFAEHSGTKYGLTTLHSALVIG